MEPRSTEDASWCVVKYCALPVQTSPLTAAKQSGFVESQRDARVRCRPSLDRHDCTWTSVSVCGRFIPLLRWVCSCAPSVKPQPLLSSPDCWLYPGNVQPFLLLYPAAALTPCMWRHRHRSMFQKSSTYCKNSAQHVSNLENSIILNIASFLTCCGE